MTIVDSLKAKGSTGGNNIAEAIENLPLGGGDGSIFVVKIVGDVYSDAGNTYLDKTYAEIENAFTSGKTIMASYTVSSIEDSGTSVTEMHRVGILSEIRFFHHINKDGTPLPNPYIVTVVVPEVGGTSYVADTATDVLRYEYDG